MYYGSGRRRRVGRPRRRGTEFLDTLRSAHDWIKKNKVVSRVAGAIGNVWAPAKAIGTAAGTEDAEGEYAEDALQALLSCQVGKL